MENEHFNLEYLKKIDDFISIKIISSIVESVYIIFV